MVRVLASVVLLAAACSGHGGPGSNEPDASDPGAGAPDAPAPDGSAPPVSTCTGKAAQPRDATWMLTSGGVTRTFDVHVPASYDPAHPTPLILNFHGYSSNSWQQDLLSKMKAKSDAVGFIAVHPQGTGQTASWNAGSCCGDAVKNAVDDVGFVRAMLDRLEADLCIDAHRVFVTGMSNGGFLSHRLGCELADRIAAIAPVAGTLIVPTCTPARPMPVMHFHGTADTLVPYDAVPDTFAGWSTRDQCTDDATVMFEKGDVTCQAHHQCAGGAETILCTVDQGGHTWPGGFPIPGVGKTTNNIIATDAMWDFFQKHPLP